jgi:hypothetical protein
MRQTVDAPTGAAAPPDRRRPAARPTRMWVLLEALGYAGAFLDPTGVLAAQRFRRAEQEDPRRGR